MKSLSRLNPWRKLANLDVVATTNKGGNHGLAQIDPDILKADVLAFVC